MARTHSLMTAIIAALAAVSAAVHAESVGLLFNAGVDAVERGSYEEAITYFNKVIKDYPDQACVYNNLGYCQMMAGHHTDAENSFTTAIRLACMHVDRVFYNRARLYMNQARYAEAMEDADVSIGLMRSEMPERYYLRGRIHNLLNQHESAVDDFTEALALDPGLSGALTYRARSLWKLKKYRSASRDIMKIHSHAGTLKMSGFPIYFVSAWVLFPSLIMIKLHNASDWVRMTRKYCDFMRRIRLLNRKQADRCIRFETGPWSTYLYVAIGIVLMSVAAPLFYMPLFI